MFSPSLQHSSNRPRPSSRCLPPATDKRLLGAYGEHHLQVDDSKQLKSNTHSVDRTAATVVCSGLGTPVVQRSPQPRLYQRSTLGSDSATPLPSYTQTRCRAIDSTRCISIIRRPRLSRSSDCFRNRPRDDADSPRARGVPLQQPSMRPRHNSGITGRTFERRAERGEFPRERADSGNRQVVDVDPEHRRVGLVSQPMQNRRFTTERGVVRRQPDRCLCAQVQQG